MISTRSIAVLFATLLALAACGGGDTTGSGPDPTEAATGTTQGQSQSDDSSDGADDSADGSGNQQIPEGGGDGVFVIDGESFYGPVFRCEPSDANEGELSLVTFISSSEGLNVDIRVRIGAPSNTQGVVYDRTRLDVLYSRPGDGNLEQFEGSATHDPEGVWYPGGGALLPGASPLAEAPYTIDGDRISGGLTLDQSWPEGGSATVEATFDLSIPSEIVGDC